ncbi:MAG: molybdopterin-dependent oxidoreductase, partial [Thermodesulfobacteria bacterium]|nr:molybdopterin-dependent oxidoreductase [Thermodesulfobacteriota bacterium]
QVELKADPWSCRYILVFGANLYEALQPGVNTYGATVANRHSRGQVKFCIVDPRGQKAIAHADRWVAIKPGSDGAFAMGLARWILENEAFNRKYLEAPNERAARKFGNGGYVNASHLVIWDEERGYDNPLHGRFLRLEHIHHENLQEKGASFMVFSKKDKALRAYQDVSRADIEAQGQVRLKDGSTVSVKTAFLLMKEAVFEHSLDHYAKACGVRRETIEEVAREFSSHAPRTAVCQYHGAGNYVGGTYAAYAVAVLNALTGSLETRGGYCSGGGPAGVWNKGNYNLVDFPGKRMPKGVKLSREKSSYQRSSEYRKKLARGENPYPARRPWFPFTKGGLCVEALAGIDEAYPYQCSALFLYFFNPVYSIPGGFRFKETLQDVRKVPLLVSIDIGINESNIYADYIIPDVTYAEGQYGWLSPHAPCFSFTSVRTPAIEPLTQKTDDGRPICLETFLIDLAQELDLPGFGENGIPGNDGTFYPLRQPEDFYLRAFSNIAQSAGLPRASGRTLKFVDSNYPVAKFKAILTDDEWSRTARLLSRGGVFHHYESAFEGDVKRNSVKRFCLYNEDLASTICSITGKRFSGTLSLEPGLKQATKEYPFTLVSFKRALHTQSRTVWHQVAMELWPENFVIMNGQDAKGLGLSHGEMVVVRGPFNKEGVEGRLFVTEAVRPGVVAVSISYGHRQLGASRVFVKGVASYQSPDARLGGGINPNELAMLDSRFNDTPYVDLVGGIPDFSSSVVRVDSVLGKGA